MIKFTAPTKEGRTLIGLGVSEENVRRMKEGHPVHVEGNQMGLDVDVLIFYGVTEQHLKNQLNDFIGPDTKVREDE